MTSGDRVKFYYIAIDQYNSRKQASTLEDDAIYFVYDNEDSDNNYIAVGSEPFDHDVSVALNKSLTRISSVASAALHSKVVDVTPTYKTISLDSSTSGTVTSFSNPSSVSLISDIGSTSASFTSASITPVGGSVSVSGIDTNTDVDASKVSDWGAAASWSFTVTGTDLEITGSNGRAASGTDVTASHVTAAITQVATAGNSTDVVAYPNGGGTYISSVSPTSSNAVAWGTTESVNIPSYSLKADNTTVSSVQLLSGVSAEIDDDSIDLNSTEVSVLDSATSISVSSAG